MLPKYLVTLAATVVAATLVVASFQFVASSRVLSGNTLSESLNFEFTIGQYDAIDADLAQFLQTHVSFTAQGPPHLVAAKVQVTPRQVSWESRPPDPFNTITAPGAAMNVQLDWNTPAGSANGASGSIDLNFPQIPGLEGKEIVIRSGPHQPDGAQSYVIRRVTTYQSAWMVALARFVYALAAGLPFGILLHTILLGVRLMSAQKRARLAALPTQGTGLPRTFYPDPVAEWAVWLPVLFAGAVWGSAAAAICVVDGFMNSWPYIALAITTAIALLAAWFTGKRVLTVRVESEGIAYARGRGNPQWTSTTWDQILGIMPKSVTNRGNQRSWIEIVFDDDRKNLKIPQSITDYAALRDLLASVALGKMRS
jgi:hypothetical protein